MPASWRLPRRHRLRRQLAGRRRRGSCSCQAHLHHLQPGRLRYHWCRRAACRPLRLLLQHVPGWIRSVVVSPRTTGTTASQSTCLTGKAAELPGQAVSQPACAWPAAISDGEGSAAAGNRSVSRSVPVAAQPQPGTVPRGPSQAAASGATPASRGRSRSRSRSRRSRSKDRARSRSADGRSKGRRNQRHSSKERHAHRGGN